MNTGPTIVFRVKTLWNNGFSADMRVDGVTPGCDVTIQTSRVAHDSESQSQTHFPLELERVNSPSICAQIVDNAAGRLAEPT